MAPLELFGVVAPLKFVTRSYDDDIANDRDDDDDDIADDEDDKDDGGYENM